MAVNVEQQYFALLASLAPQASGAPAIGFSAERLATTGTGKRCRERDAVVKTDFRTAA
jgi:hypothetical protein